jgi:hypothetical protein
MSTQINVAIGDQRLLQQSKTRAAANQQSLDSRLEEQQLAEQLTEAVDETTPEDPRSDAFSLQLDRHPAAQRRRDKPLTDDDDDSDDSQLKGLNFVGLANLELSPVPETNQLITIPWVATSDPFPFSQAVNLIEVDTVEYLPKAELLIQRADTTIASSVSIPGGIPYTIPLNTKQLDWYTAFRANNFFPSFGGLSGPVEQVRTPPPLPFPWQDLRSVNNSSTGTFQYEIISSAADTVYVSTLFRVLFPPSQLTFRADDPLYYTLISNFRISPFPRGLSVSLARKTMLYWTKPVEFRTDPPTINLGAAPILVYQDVAVYTKINTKTKQIETRFEFFNVVDTKTLGMVPALQFLTYLYADDPLRAIHLETVNNFSEGQRQQQALSRVVSSNFYWPNFINYDKTTGIVVALANTDDPNKKDVMNLQLNTNLAYPVVLQLIGGEFWSELSNPTRASFTQRGFTYVKTVEIISSLATGYTAVVPVQIA